jgi:hypothetical protein
MQREIRVKLPTLFSPSPGGTPGVCAVSADTSIPRSVVAAGCGEVGGADDTAACATGQPVIGMMTGTSVIDESGVWSHSRWISPVAYDRLLSALYSFRMNPPKPVNSATTLRLSVPARSQVTERPHEWVAGSHGGSSSASLTADANACSWMSGASGRRIRSSDARSRIRTGLETRVV